MGNHIQLQIFGESHSTAIGMTLCGVPAGVKIDMDALQAFLLRRAPGRDATATARKEPDIPEFLSGVVENVTTGAPITAIIRNSDQHSRDYEKLRHLPRPSHSDYAAAVKYGGHNDIRGGGAFSGRLTAPLCIAGGIAKQILASRGIEVGAHVRIIGGIADLPFDAVDPGDVTAPGKKPFPTISDEAGKRMREAILQAKANGDSVGGSIECAVTGMPAGYGGPLFDGVEGKIASALFGIPAVKGVEFGSGFNVVNLYGSENNDPFAYRDGKVVTETNHSGGIQGGITNGMPILVHAALKPTPSIAKEQKTVNLETKEETTLVIGGRHDPCVVVRAVPAVEAAVALCILDLLSEDN
ncbi:MAG: chorismate synthase [Clostridia bacterium]|nr:chorismate synthase [Clostridia bacterium]